MRCQSILLTLSAALIVVPTPARAAAPLPGATIRKVCAGPPQCDPDGAGRARPGDPIACTLRVTNESAAGALRVDTITDAIAHAAGTTTTGNLLPLGQPVLLAPGAFVDVAVNDVVAAGDGPALADGATATGVYLAVAPPNDAFRLAIGATATVVACCADADCPTDECGTGACVGNACVRTPRAAGTACTEDGNPCTVDRCDGASLACRHDAGNAGVVCRASAGACDPTEYCTGTDPTCPADARTDAGTPCRAARNECDVAETCDGSSVTCPADVVVAPGTPCTDDGLVCTTDRCNGSVAAPACVHDPGNAGTVCRAGSGDACDPPETCTGASATCPPDVVQPGGYACRPAAGACDVAETCSGTPGRPCPPDAKVPVDTACPDDGNPCTRDACDGSSNVCQHPAGNGGVPCRPAAGACDVAESCTGTSAACPDDGFAPSSVVCRAANGECDVAERCTGSAADCPADVKKTPGTACGDDGNPCTTDLCGGGDACVHDPGNAGAVCRAGSGDVCDPSETCSGTSADCPPDVVQPAGTTCRASAGACDAPETCTGNAGVRCPADAKLPGDTTCPDDGNPCTRDVCDGASNACTHPAGNPGAVCRPAAGPCDVAETCTGTAASCPVDRFAPSTVVCRDAAGECDVAETCSGAGPDCPADRTRATGTPCTDDGNPCTTDLCDGAFCTHRPGNPGVVCRAACGPCGVAARCDGATTICPTTGVLPAGAVCRPAVGGCDVAETCDGVGCGCPDDVRLPAGTVCRAAAGACDVAESCDGTSGVCPADRFAALGLLCRPSAGECDAAEYCTGSGPACPADGKRAAGSPCTADTNPCTADVCDGTQATCQHPAGNAGTVCRAAKSDCDVAERCTGTSTACPSNKYRPAGYACEADGDACTVDACDGSGACRFFQEASACRICGSDVTAPCVATVSSPPGTFASVQTAVDNALDGATITVQGLCVGSVLVSGRANLTIQGVPPTVNGCPPAGLQPTDLTSTIVASGSAEAIKVVSSTNVVTRFLNVIDAGPDHDGVEYKSAASGAVHCNCIAFNDEGIEVDGGQSVSATANLLTRNFGQGLRLKDGSVLDAVTGNFSTQNGEDGISVKDSTQNAVGANRVTNNGQDGIDLDNADGNRVTGNQVTGNGTKAAGDSGIECENGSDGNTIDGNAISGNADGLVNLLRCFSGHLNTGSNVPPACQ